MTVEKFEKNISEIKKYEAKIEDLAKTIKRDYINKEEKNILVKIDDEFFCFKNTDILNLFKRQLEDLKKEYEGKIKEINDIGIKIESKFNDEFWKEILK